MTDRQTEPDGAADISTGEVPPPEPDDTPKTIGTVIEHSAWRSRRAWQIVSVLVAVLIVVIVVLAVVVVSQGDTISALTGKGGTIPALTAKSQEQTKAEVQLRHTNASQQATIRKQATTIAEFTSKAAVSVEAGQQTLITAARQLLGYDQALGVIFIDAIDGAPRKVLLRDLQALARLLPPLP